MIAFLAIIPVITLVQHFLLGPSTVPRYGRHAKVTWWDRLERDRKTWLVGGAVALAVWLGFRVGIFVDRGTGPWAGAIDLASILVVAESVISFYWIPFTRKHPKIAAAIMAMMAASAAANAARERQEAERRAYFQQMQQAMYPQPDPWAQAQAWKQAQQQPNPYQHPLGLEQPHQPPGWQPRQPVPRRPLL